MTNPNLELTKYLITHNIMESSWANKQGKKFWPGLKEAGLGLLDIGQSGLI